MSNLKQLAQSILDKTDRNDVAVFAWRGEILVSKVSAESTQKRMNSDRNRWKLVGIYNTFCKLEWLIEDLKYVNAQCD